MVDLTAAARRITSERKARNWTILELSRQSGINAGFISQIESGKRQVSLSTLVTLARVFSISLDAMLTAPEAVESVA